MTILMTRWLAPAVLAAGLGFGAMTPAPVQAQDSLTRVLVNIADVVFNNGAPYYRGDAGYNDRLIVSNDRYGRPVYYRQVPYGYNTNNYDPRNYSQRVVYDQYGRRIYDQYGRRIDYASRYYGNGYSSGAPYGHAYGYYRNGPGSRQVKCNKHGKCKGEHYDGRHDRDDHDWGDDRGHDDDD
ncbi:MAG TPA: hypothetical protein VHF02_05745 [Luteimonas sp.]|nr:hypothetical protein [Luteimonas sp.]